MACKSCGGVLDGSNKQYCKKCFNAKAKAWRLARNERIKNDGEILKMYAVVDLTEAENIIFLGTAKEVARYTKTSVSTVYSRALDEKCNGSRKGNRIINLGKI